MDYDCIAANYVESMGSQRHSELWHTKAKNTINGEEFSIRSKAIINACGPWVDQYNAFNKQTTNYRHLFSKGIHLIVDKIGDTEKVLTFFASDGRMFFVIPMGPKTCIGTTDTQVSKPSADINDQDRQFVLDNINALLDLPTSLTKADIVAERCGIRPLAQEGGDGIADWVKLSRKHSIEVNLDDQYMSIFGGKLTDCINVGNEVAKHINAMKIKTPYPNKKWYGEPSQSVHDEFLHQAKLMELDDMTDPTSPELLTTRLWRRYGRNALEILESIREYPERAELLIENAEYLRAEIELAARREMITTLDDFLRRRSKISQVVSQQDIINAPGLKLACEILFGDLAEDKFNEYIQTRANTG
jgi:alpha-glycerophosphate oxidase/glycerol-3-phosphate dehydrogenase